MGSRRKLITWRVRARAFGPRAVCASDASITCVAATGGDGALRILTGHEVCDLTHPLVYDAIADTGTAIDDNDDGYWQ